MTNFIDHTIGFTLIKRKILNMLKLKTVRSVSKRFKKTANGHFKYKHANLRHILTKKTMNRKRHLRSKSLVSKCELNLIISCLPYS